MLKRAYNDIDGNKEMIERIFTLLYRIEFTFEILDESQVDTPEQHYHPLPPPAAAVHLFIIAGTYN